MKNKALNYMAYFIIINTFMFIIATYWFIINHLLFDKSSRKMELLEYKSVKTLRVLECTCNRFLCSLERMGAVKLNCHSKTLYKVLPSGL